MNKGIKISFLMMLFIGIFALTSCDLFGIGSDSDAGETGSDIEISDDMTDEEAMEAINNGIVFEEEQEGADLHFRKSVDAEYIGKWEATSGQSIYNYGNIDLTISPGGVWKGNIAEEDLSGTWTLEGNALVLTSEYFGAKLSFTNDDKLIMQEDRDPEDDDEEYINTVLTRKK